MNDDFLEETDAMDAKNTDLRHDISDRDFYNTAYSYFEYHAGQRMTMINFYLVIFAAAIAGYTGAYKDLPVISIVIAGISCIISALFHFIDRRNCFDVKHSQSVLAQIERDYGADRFHSQNDTHVYGVFSNEDNCFKYYRAKSRLNIRLFGNARRTARRLRRQERRGNTEKANDLKIKLSNLEHQIIYEQNDRNRVSQKELDNALREHGTLGLGVCISLLYGICGVISLAAMILAIVFH